MNQSALEIPVYGSWVNKKLIYVPAVLCLVMLGLAFFVPALAILAFLFLLTAVYFAYARYLFSKQGGDVQGKICANLFTHFDWDGDGKVLDIGCGSASIVIGLAKKYPKALVTGIDDWGKAWEYSQAVCERNARVEGVDSRVVFQNASAAQLPFSDEEFDAVVSNMVFHEVAGSVDKRELVKEALRVLKKGAPFAFQDLFLIEPMYGKTDALLDTIRGWGISHVEFIETCNEPFVPTVLKLPFMVGTAGILVGVK